eukprot:756464-Hanusia_phi.AAC.1
MNKVRVAEGKGAWDGRGGGGGGGGGDGRDGGHVLKGGHGRSCRGALTSAGCGLVVGSGEEEDSRMKEDEQYRLISVVQGKCGIDAAGAMVDEEHTAQERIMSKLASCQLENGAWSA